MTNRVLVVTEDPAFIQEVRSELGGAAAVVACLGQGHCAMKQRGTCSLAAGADYVLVDVPAGGAFHDHHKGIAGITYAERLAETHPDSSVALCMADAPQPPNAFLKRTDVLAIVSADMTNIG
jgi:methyl coenzyme M reductase subunit C